MFCRHWFMSAIACHWLEDCAGFYGDQVADRVDALYRRAYPRQYAGIM